jgi:hypothetical protein
MSRQVYNASKEWTQAMLQRAVEFLKANEALINSIGLSAGLIGVIAALAVGAPVAGTLAAITAAISVGVTIANVAIQVSSGNMTLTQGVATVGLTIGLAGLGVISGATMTAFVNARALPSSRQAAVLAGVLLGHIGITTASMTMTTSDYVRSRLRR